MADIVNLRQARKAKTRLASGAKAASNRLMHGRTKAKKAAAKMEQARADKLLDGARRDRD